MVKFTAAFPDLDFVNNTDPYINLRMSNPGWIGLYAFDNRITPHASIEKRFAAYKTWKDEENNAISAHNSVLIAHEKAVAAGTATQTQAQAETAAKTAYNNYKNQLAYKRAIQKRDLYWEKPAGHNFYKLRLHSYNRGVDGLDPNGNGPFTYAYGDTIMDYGFIITSQVQDEGAEGIYPASVFPAFHNWEYDLGVPQNRVQPGWRSRENPKPIPCDGQVVEQPAQTITTPPPNDDSQDPGSQNTQPNTPTDLLTTFGNGQVRLSWTAGGGTTTDYQYRYRESGGSWRDWVSVLLSNPDVLSDTEVLILSLINGTTYEFQVRAMNGESASTATESSESTPATVPGKPTSLSGYGYNGWVSLSWTAPNNNGADISDYEYQYCRTYQLFGLSWTAWGNSNTLNSVFNLTNGTQYKFRIRAVNSEGKSLPSATAYATPATIPSAPQNLNGTPGDGEVALYWEAPISNGGATITDYKYSYREVSSDSWRPWASAGTDGCKRITGLTNGTEYEFSVLAKNRAGEGPAGSEISVTAGLSSFTPGAPQNFLPYDGNGQVELWWDAPNDDGGSAITDYEYSYRETGGCWGKWSSTGVGAGTEFDNSYIVSGLTNGTTYDFDVRAVNIYGGGTSAGALSETPEPNTPGQVTNVSASTGSTTGSIDLSWTAPDDGGQAITHYEYTYGKITNGRWQWVSYSSTGSTSTSFTVTGLDSGVLYRLRVRAHNGVSGIHRISRYAQARAK